MNYCNLIHVVVAMLKKAETVAEKSSISQISEYLELHTFTHCLLVVCESSLLMQQQVC